MPTVLYGYYYNPCIHESAAMLVSLHASKTGAWRAKRRAHFAAAQDAREKYLSAGYPFDLRSERWFIAPIEVLP